LYTKWAPCRGGRDACRQLLGSHKTWSPADQSRYDSGEALGIVTYSAIFNAAPKVGEPGTIVFATPTRLKQYVAEAWSVSVNRFQDDKAYLALLKVVRPALSGMFYQRMENTVGRHPGPARCAAGCPAPPNKRWQRRSTVLLAS